MGQSKEKTALATGGNGGLATAKRFVNEGAYTGASRRSCRRRSGLAGFATVARSSSMLSVGVSLICVGATAQGRYARNRERADRQDQRWTGALAGWTGDRSDRSRPSRLGGCFPKACPLWRTGWRGPSLPARPNGGGKTHWLP